MKNFCETLYLTPLFKDERLVLPYMDTEIELVNKEHPSVFEIVELLEKYNAMGDDRISVDLKIKGRHDDFNIEIISVSMELSSYWGGEEFLDDDFLDALPVEGKLSKNEGFGKIINYHLEDE